jgi:beta propeller repeat protein
VIAFGLVLSARAGAQGTITRLSTGSVQDQQNSPAISGANVVWTDATSGASGSNFDIFLFKLGSGIPPVNLTNTPAEQEFLPDIDGDNIVWTHTAPGIPGDVVVYNIATAAISTVASSTSTVHFEQPAIHGRYITFLRITSSQIDVELFDNLLGVPLGPVTNDAAAQGRPRVGDDIVVYEDYNSGKADIFGWRISTNGPPFAIARGPNAQTQPDIDGNTVVWVENVGAGNDQIFEYDLVSATTRQLTSVASNKILPRISGHRVVWTDDRNGNLDIFALDLNTRTEEPLVTGPGDQFLADIDGDRVVYTDNASGFEQVFMFTFSTNITVAIDIEPGRFPNVVNLKSRGEIPVAVLSSPAFDALTQVDKTSLAFGHTGTEPSLAFCNPSGEDVNGDGLPDLICHFKTQLTGFQLGDTLGVLTGKDINGNSLRGTDSVKIVRHGRDDDDDDHADDDHDGERHERHEHGEHHRQ